MTSGAWPHGSPTVGQSAERSRLIHYDPVVAAGTPFGDVVLKGTARCFTFPLPAGAA